VYKLGEVFKVNRIMKNDWYCLQLIREPGSIDSVRRIDASGRWYSTDSDYPLLVWLDSESAEDGLRKIASSRGGIMEVGRASRSEFTLGANAVIFDEILHISAIEPGFDLNPFKLSAEEVKFLRICALFNSLERDISNDSAHLTACVAEFHSQLVERYPLDNFESACNFVAGPVGMAIYGRVLDRRIVPDSVLTIDRVTQGFEFAREQLQFMA
jgi:hypothetical protein